MTTYYVYGDYGYNLEQELYQSTCLQEARDFARDYTRWGDFGGYNQIEVAWFTDDGEYMTDARYFATDDDGFDADIYDDEPAYDYYSD
jgi:hypothetical protein